MSEFTDMNLQRLAAIATIIGTLIAAWQFLGIPANNETSLPNQLAKEKAAISLTLDMPIYKGERNWLLAMYEAAIAMPYSSTKSDALQQVVNTAIENRDFNMAIIAANHSPYSSTKADMLNRIVDAAKTNIDTIGYAVIAADKMPYSSSKADALSRIISSYALFAKNRADGQAK